MKRNEFLKVSGLVGLGILVLPHLSFQETMNQFTRSQLIGKGNPDIVGKTYTSKMHKLTRKALDAMTVEAAKDGIAIEVVSSYRSFHRQKEIYERKYRQFTGQGLSPEMAIEKIIEYSTIPGTSRHHWGTDIDLIDANAPRPASVLEPNNFHGNGPYCKFKEWMDKNAQRFDFFEVYTDNANRKGFKYEPWHFSYAPVSVPMLREYRDRIDVIEMLSEEKILGNENFTKEFITRYTKENILDINPELLS